MVPLNLCVSDITLFFCIKGFANSIIQMNIIIIISIVITLKCQFCFPLTSKDRNSQTTLEGANLTCLIGLEANKMDLHFIDIK